MKTFQDFFIEAINTLNSFFQIKGDSDLLEAWLDVQNNQLILSEDEMPRETDEIAPLIYKSSPSLLTVEIEGLDPSADGTENFYIVKNNKVLDTIATFFENEIVSVDRAEYESAKSFGDIIRKGQIEFGVNLGKAGFAGEDTGNLKVFLYKQGSINKLKKFLNENV
jgi:hypothetical protein